MKKPYRHAELILVICFFMLLFPVAIQADPVRRISEQKALTLDECIALALDRASGIKKAEYNLGLTGEEILKNYGQFLPKISVNASYTPVSESTTFLPEGSSAATTSSERIDIGVSASLNLFRFCRLCSPEILDKPNAFSRTDTLQGTSDRCVRHNPGILPYSA
ncbi:MAG TPA: hypothetical protein ENN50_04810 [Prosthecochloris aestuarii]|uniref:Outer membrane efflux protein n=1 Tax=Prosthecochloris aestuarii TaxID=1102 RepID=A0A831WV99_PROAE|nr:hypothetical protein [Prosthecochloris aestuarii]